LFKRRRGLSSPLFTVQKLSTVRVFAQIPAAQAPSLHSGMAASLTFADGGADAGGDKPLTGTIARTSGSLDPATRTMKAEIDLPNTKGTLLPGNFTRARIITATHTGVLGLPNGAIGTDSAGAFVLTVVGGKVARRPVKTGITDGKLTEVISGLEQSDVVLASAKGAPPAGAAVQTRIAS
jgi:RND family efflux transporter MFP subunit